MQTKSIYIYILYIHICIYFQNFIMNQKQKNNQLANKFNKSNGGRVEKFFKFIRKQKLRVGNDNDNDNDNDNKFAQQNTSKKKKG